MAGGTSVVIVSDSEDFGGTELMMTSIAKGISEDDLNTYNNRLKETYKNWL